MPQRKPAVKQQAEAVLRLDLIAAQRGWRLEGDEECGYQLADARTSTLVAAEWAKGGFGLSLEQIEAVLDASS